MSFEEFAHLAARFLIEEEEDTEAILRELKDAFRLYDKQGLGYIGVDLLREILKELDDKITPKDLDQMIEEIDTDGSGTVDWEGKILNFLEDSKLTIFNYRVQSHDDRINNFKLWIIFPILYIFQCHKYYLQNAPVWCVEEMGIMPGVVHLL